MLYERSKWTKVVTHTVKMDPGIVQVYVIHTHKKEKKNPTCNIPKFTICINYAVN